MVSVEQQIEEIEREIRETPYHKGTERHIGILKAKIAKLKNKLEEDLNKKGGGGGGYAVRKQGDATVVLVGPPSAGKSTLLNALTNAESKVAPYAFTTVSVIPGMMKYNDAYIQILDVPGLIEGAEEGKGRGREVISVVRGADLLIIISDVERPGAVNKIKNALERNGIRINKNPPDILVEKKIKGGIIVKTNIKQDFEKNTVSEIAYEMGIKNAEIQIKQKVSIDELIDVFAKNRVYVPAISVINKADTIKDSKLSNDDFLFISAEKNYNLDELRRAIWGNLNLVKIYLIKQSSDINEENPMIVKKNQTLEDVVKNIGSNFAATYTKAKIWGDGAKYPGQEVSLKTQVCSGMKVRFI